MDTFRQHVQVEVADSVRKIPKKEFLESFIQARALARAKGTL